MKVTVLGSGTSQGVPVISCDCPICTSSNPKNNRMRASIMLEFNQKCIVIDTGPDFRNQMLQHQVKGVHAVLYTHEHKDHIAGLDDIRAFNYLQQIIPTIYAEERVHEALKREFAYIFADIKYPGIPKIEVKNIQNSPFELFEELIIPIRALHYKLPVFGFRVRNFAYITDANYIAKEELEKLKGLDVLIINALQRHEHISHFTEAEAVDLIQKLQPKQAYLTHISHLYDDHENINNGLPDGIEAAYDGLLIHL